MLMLFLSFFIFFLRIYCEDKHTFLQDCEDDGETAAGGRLLHLMQVMRSQRLISITLSRF